jgi:hypothetical protein
MHEGLRYGTSVDMSASRLFTTLIHVKGIAKEENLWQPTQ